MCSNSNMELNFESGKQFTSSIEVIDVIPSELDCKTGTAVLPACLLDDSTDICDRENTYSAKCQKSHPSNQACPGKETSSGQNTNYSLDSLEVEYEPDGVKIDSILSDVNVSTCDRKICTAYIKIRCSYCCATTCMCT